MNFHQSKVPILVFAGKLASRGVQGEGVFLGKPKDS